MTKLSKRDLLFAIVAVSASAATPALAQTAPDLSSGRAIGEAYVAAHPGVDLGALRAALLPAGLDSEAITRLRSSVAEDFRQNRLFIHNGWRLSQTEAQLFALLTL